MRIPTSYLLGLSHRITKMTMAAIMNVYMNDTEGVRESGLGVLVVISVI